MLKRSSLVVLLMAPTVLCQATWNVPLGGNLASFLSQASPGDILVLAAGGSYGPVTVNKGVTILGRGASVSNPTFQVPQGQKASLVDVVLSHPGLGFSNTLLILGGLVELSAISSQAGPTSSGGSVVDVRGGEVVIQRFAGSLAVSGGRCWVTDSSLYGKRAEDLSVIQMPSSRALVQSGGEVLVSHCSIAGGNGVTYVPYGSGNPILTYVQASVGIHQTAGVMRLTDCNVSGGHVPPFPGKVAIQATGTMSIARTVVVDGYLAGTSSGFHLAEEMVGITSTGTPILGATFTATAQAGTAQDLMGIVGGFRRGSSIVPPIVEPLFGDAAQLFTVAIGVPPAGGTLSTTVNVPNVVGLVGVEVWLQAVQVVGATIRASTVVGGTIR
ncbi:MAG: hypothetical protein MUC36_14310 [Planctomycetes bacterium]|jgi:hypothetical protein|nr:hypothetical protein [Planctomycetota bacterium]